MVILLDFYLDVVMVQEKVLEKVQMMVPKLVQGMVARMDSVMVQDLVPVMVPPFVDRLDLTMVQDLVLVRVPPLDE